MLPRSRSRLPQWSLNASNSASRIGPPLLLGHGSNVEAIGQGNVRDVVERRPAHQEEVADGHEPGAGEKCPVAGLLLLCVGPDDDRDAGVLDRGTLADPRETSNPAARSRGLAVGTAGAPSLHIS